MIVLLTILTLLVNSNALLRDTACQEVIKSLGGVETEWIGYPQGWDLPSDIEIVEKIDFANDGGIWIFESESEPKTTWMWWFFSYASSADSNGNHFGAHDFCAIKLGGN